MEAYLLDTSVLTPLVQTVHAKHQAATTLITGLGTAPIYVSAISLAEMQYGFQLYEKSTGGLLPSAKQMITAAQSFPRLDISRHTAAAYAELKATLATYYLPKVTKQFRKKYVEDWVDQFTGKALMVDDNDLWICAQALEMNFVVVAGDKMERIRAAEPKLKFLQIP